MSGISRAACIFAAILVTGNAATVSVTPSSSVPSVVKQTANRHHRRPITQDVLPHALADASELDKTKGEEVEAVSLAAEGLSSCLRGGNSDTSSSLLERLEVGFYFALWYALNVIYNILNKKVLNVLPAAVTVGTLQLGIGALYVSSLWLLRIRPSPALTAEGKEKCALVGCFHGAGQLLSMVSLGAGPVSFTHIVKALEPFFSALVSALVFGKWMKLPVYLSLIPVVGGVGYACLKERSFSWLAFWSAMGSNLAFALRAVFSKTAMTNYIGENLSSANLFGVVTWLSFFFSIPLVFLIEGFSFIKLWSDATSGKGAVAPAEMARSLIVSGLFHYLNNEVMYLALSNVHPVTLAVGNTMKRVFIMVASILVFRNPVSVQAGIGSAVGICGVLLYSLTKQHYEKLEVEELLAKKE